MAKLKENMNLMIPVLIVFFSGINIAICKSDYIYRPKSYLLFFVLYLTASSVLTYFAVKYRKSSSDMSRVIGCFIIFASFIYVITLAFCFDFKIDNKINNVAYYELLFLVSLASSLTIFFACNKIRWLKIFVGILTATFSAIFALGLFFSILLSTFGENTIVQTVKSPDNTHVAWVISSDQGALGGSTDVYVRNTEKDIPLLFGILKTESNWLWTARWGTEPDLRWKDNNTLLIDETSYDLDNLPDYVT